MMMDERLLRQLIREALILEAFVTVDWGDDKKPETFDIPDDELEDLQVSVRSGLSSAQRKRRGREDVKLELPTRLYVAETAFTEMLTDLADSDTAKKIEALGLRNKEEWEIYFLTHDTSGDLVPGTEIEGDFPAYVHKMEADPKAKPPKTELDKETGEVKSQGPLKIYYRAKAKKNEDGSRPKNPDGSDKWEWKVKSTNTAEVKAKMGANTYDPAAAVKMKDMLTRIYRTDKGNFAEIVDYFPFDAEGGAAKPNPDTSKPPFAAPTGAAGATHEVPKGLLSVMKYTEHGGKEIGAGEMLIPLMYIGGQVAAGGNPAFDVEIAGAGYHVKEEDPKNGIRFGSGKGKTFSGSTTQKSWKDAAADEVKWNAAAASPEEAKELKKLIGEAEIGNRNLVKIIKLVAAVTGQSASEVYKEFNDEAQGRAIPDPGYGTIWAHPKGNPTTLTFLPKTQHFVKQMTQAGRYVFGNAKVGGEMTTALGGANESLIRNFIRNSLMTEALTASDEKAIGVIARKEAQKLWDDKWEKKILDIIKKELKDVYKGKDFKDAVVKIHKKAQLAYLRLQWEKGRQFTRYDVSAS